MSDTINELTVFLKHAITYMSGDLLRKIAGFLMVPIYTRYLMTKGYGVLEMLDITVTVLSLFLGMRITSAVVRFYFEYDNQREKDEVVCTALFAVLFVSSVMVGVSFALSDRVSLLVFDTLRYEKHFKIAFLALALSLVTSVPESALIAAKRSVFYTCINFFVFLSYLSLNIYFVVIAERGVIGILFSSLITKAAYTIFLLFWFFRRHSLSFSPSKLKMMIQYGLPLMPASIGMFVLNYADRFVLQKLSTTSEVGIYALGYKLAFMLAFLVVDPVQRILNPQIFEMSQGADSKASIPTMFTYLTLVVTFSALSLVILAQPAITIVATPDFYPATEAIPYIVLGYYFMGLSTFFQTTLMIKKKTWHIGLCVFLSAITNPMLNLILVPKYGAMGAAYSTTISFLIMFVTIYCSAQKQFFVSCESKRIGKLVVVALIILFLDRMFVIQSLILQVVVKMFLIATFPVFLWIAHFFQPEEIDHVRVWILNCFSTQKV